MVRSRQGEAPIGGGQYQTVRLADFETDGRFNRPVSQRHVDRIVHDFNARAFVVIVAWGRDDGRLVILDGQHRVGAARLRGIPEDAKVIPTIIHRGLTLDAAAELFVQLNASKFVGAYDKFHALRTAGHAETVAIDAIVTAHGLRITRAPGDGCISAVTAVQWVHQTGEPEGAVLGNVLAAMQQTWGILKEAYTAPIIRGIGRYFHEHRDTVPTELAEALRRSPGSTPLNLMALGKTIAGSQRMPLDQAIAEAIETRVMKRVARPRKVS